ncbi:MAG: DUF1501 domain-containing protein [Planctomycetota bacterium]|nr:DUF1501 domain-containing protein [Planctomycetota bacterium]
MFNLPAEFLDRRQFLSFSGHGLGGAALLSLLARDGLLAAGGTSESDDPPPHHKPRARRAIHIYACGGVSQVDTFDYKPELLRLHGKSLNADERPDVFFGQVGLLRKPDWDFEQHGECGKWVSSLFPHLAGEVDNMAFIHSMFAETSNHTPATFQANTGFRLNGFPTMGAWLSYGLGNETEDLPTYVVIPDNRGLPAGGSINWSNGFLPARHQGVVVKSRGTAIADLNPAKPLSTETELASRKLLAEVNRKHFDDRGHDDLAARIRAYELAARMQLAVPEVAALDKETEATQQAYGLDRPNTVDFGRSCLMARRLLERGVRFVQLFAGGAFGSPRINWDGHENMRENHGQEAGRCDQPLAALLWDLKRRGMLDDTLVLFTSEFGRTPFAQSADGVLGNGRDHNQAGFTSWMSGGGVKGGVSYGATDDVGYRAVDKRTSWHDFHATVLHLLGINHERLTYYHNGIRRRLTNVHGEILQEILV